MKHLLHPRVLLACVILVGVGWGCAPQVPQYRIGVSQCLDDAWRRRMNDEMDRELLLYPDLSLTTRVAYGDNELQCAQIDSFIRERVDLLIVSPNEAVAIQPAVSRAHRAGIPVLVADRRVAGEEWTAFIGGDNLQVGHLLGERLCDLAAEHQGPINVCEVVGRPGSTPAVLRHTGLLEQIQNAPNVHYVGYVLGEWFEQPAYRAVDSLLRVNPDIDVIVGQNDLMAQGASRAARERGRPIYILGVDALGGPEGGLQAILDGKIDASATYLSRGDMVIQCAAHILHGEPYTRDTVLESSLIDQETAEMMLHAEQRKAHDEESIRSLEAKMLQLGDEYRVQRLLNNSLIALLAVVMVLVGVLIYVWRYRMRVHRERAEREAKLQHQAEQLQSITQELARTKAQINDETVFLRKLKAEIEKRLTDPDLDVASLSEELGMSRTSLYRKIKLTTGKSPTELVRHIRLEKAHQLLQDTDLTIQQITYDVGFSSPSYFAKCYKASFGVSPTEVERKNKKRNK